MACGGCAGEEEGGWEFGNEFGWVGTGQGARLGGRCVLRSPGEGAGRGGCEGECILWGGGKGCVAFDGVGLASREPWDRGGGIPAFLLGVGVGGA